MTFFLLPPNNRYRGPTSIVTIVIGFGMLVGIMIMPLAAAAQGQGWQGLVPCGNTIADPCTFSDAIEIAKKIINFLFEFIVLPALAVGILAAGILILTSGGSSGQIERGKRILWNIGIGFLVAASAWMIVNMAVCALTGGGTGFLARFISNFPSCPAP